MFTLSYGIFSTIARSVWLSLVLDVLSARHRTLTVDAAGCPV